MKNRFVIFVIYSLIITTVLIVGFSIFKQRYAKQETFQQAIVDQQDNTMSKEDSLRTARANILLSQKDSIIQSLKLKILNEKVNTATQKAEVRKHKAINDTLQAQFNRDKNLSNCEDLVHGLKLETIEKDSVIESLDAETENYSCEVKELEEKVEIQKGIIDSKQNLIATKDSTITFYKTQKKKSEFWNKVKSNAAGIIILIETIALIIK